MTDEMSQSDCDKYKTLNAIIRSMEFEKDIVVVPTIDLIEMVQAIRLYQQQIEQLQTPDWVDDNLKRIKQYTCRNLVDD